MLRRLHVLGVAGQSNRQSLNVCLVELLKTVGSLICHFSLLSGSVGHFAVGVALPLPVLLKLEFQVNDLNCAVEYHVVVEV